MRSSVLHAKLAVAVLAMATAFGISGCQTAGKLVITPPPPLPEISIPLWKVEKKQAEESNLPGLDSTDLMPWDDKWQAPVASSK